MKQLRVTEQAALQVIQEAVRVLAVWTNSKLKENLPELIAANGNQDVIKKAVAEAQKLLSWNRMTHLKHYVCCLTQSTWKKTKIKRVKISINIIGSQMLLPIEILKYLTP
jgi:hypothetical protein